MTDTGVSTTKPITDTGTLDLHLGQALNVIRDSLSLNPNQLAELLGVSLVAVDRWTRGVGQPSIDQWKRIRDILDSTNSRRFYSDRIFPSRGSSRRALKVIQTSQLSLFDSRPTIQQTSAPGSPILERVKTGKFFGPADMLREVLLRNSVPAETQSEPVATGTSAGKNTYTYDAHTYHTKVPPQGILEYLKHYLPTGGLVLDPFAGSGMTGVAALTGGYDVILNELSPAACFIAHNYTETVRPEDFVEAMDAIVNALAVLRKRLYSTTCRECGKSIEALYYVWSYKVVCYECDHEFLLWDHSRKYGRTVKEHKILNIFPCPSCGEVLEKRKLSRTNTEMVLVGYKCCQRSIREHKPDQADIGRATGIEAERLLIEEFAPHTALPDGVNLNQPKRHGLTSVSAFYSTRNLVALSHIWRQIHCIDDVSLASAMAFVFTSLYQRVSKLSEYRFWGGSGNMARFNVPFIFNEANVFVTFERKAATILDHLEITASRYTAKKAVVMGSAVDMAYLPDESVDLIFTDPPFGANINYSEMNILWEAWLGEFTDTTTEAIVNRHQGKDVVGYGRLMTQCLSECYRVLRDEHWLLLVFMNSSASVWKELKQAIIRAGFIIERADIFDKQHGTFKQFVSPNAAGCDLIIHCKKSTKRDRNEEEIFVSLRDSISLFFKDYPKDIPTTVYLHVERAEEVDYRLMYSDWISYALMRNHEMADFAMFRHVANELLQGET